MPAKDEMKRVDIVTSNGGGGEAVSFPEFELKPYGNYQYTIQFDDIDYIGDKEKYQPFYIWKLSTGNKKYSKLLVPTKSGTTSTANLSLLHDGGIYSLSASRVADKTYVFSATSDGSPIDPTIQHGTERYMRAPEYSPSTGWVISLPQNSNNATWISPEEWWRIAKESISVMRVSTIGDSETVFIQLINAVKQLAEASAGTFVTKYIALPGEPFAEFLMSVWTSLSGGTPCALQIGNGIFIIKGCSSPLNAGFASFTYSEVDDTNHKIYDIDITISSSTVYLKGICNVATLLPID